MIRVSFNTEFSYASQVFTSVPESFRFINHLLLNTNNTFNTITYVDENGFYFVEDKLKNLMINLQVLLPEIQMMEFL